MSTLAFADDMARLQRALAQCHDMVIRRSAVLEALQLHRGERVHRVLRPGGRVVILATNWSSVVWPSE